MLREMRLTLAEWDSPEILGLHGFCNRHDIAGASRSRAEWFERMV